MEVMIRQTNTITKEKNKRTKIWTWAVDYILLLNAETGSGISGFFLLCKLITEVAFEAISMQSCVLNIKFLYTVVTQWFDTHARYFSAKSCFFLPVILSLQLFDPPCEKSTVVYS